VTLHQLPKTTAKKKKRLGRGYGSGKGGHTSSRGQKGQKARNRVGLLFEGTKTRKSFIRRMPMLKGKGKLISFERKPTIINLSDLGQFSGGSAVTLETLVKIGLVSEKSKSGGVKVLGRGPAPKKLTLAVPVSSNAAKKIEAAGGKVVSLPPGVKQPSRAKQSKEQS
jgi:large subunit ribosomal protein L15